MELHVTSALHIQPADQVPTFLFDASQVHHFNNAEDMGNDGGR